MYTARCTQDPEYICSVYHTLLGIVRTLKFLYSFLCTLVNKAKTLGVLSVLCILVKGSRDPGDLSFLVYTCRCTQDPEDLAYNYLTIFQEFLFIYTPQVTCDI